jgi:phosphoribosylaminoimidazole (AIR) synthetase
MGIGMVVVCSPANATIIKTHFEAFGYTYYEIGKVIAGNREVLL